MKKLFAIGEALIDFIPQNTGVGIAQVEAFAPHVGGAPANVCAAYHKLGGPSAMITQLGDDPFGDKIQNLLADTGIDTSYVRRTGEATTSLAFVALKEDGNREFSFFRKPGADMLYKPEYLQKDWFADGFALHYCSVDLGNFPMKDAHRTAIEYAGECGLLISFDPNLRFNLWDDLNALKEAVLEFMPKSDIVKISDEELAFITGHTDIEAALPALFKGSTKLVIYTEGAAGARAYTRDAAAHHVAAPVKAIDTTGAGDAFIGAFLHQLARDGVNSQNIGELSCQKLREYLEFCNRYCGMSVQKNGAISSYPTLQEMA